MRIWVAMAQGKRGIWLSIFPDRENTENLIKTWAKHRESGKGREIQ